MRDEITVPLDRLASAALEVLIADGTNIPDAVGAAIVDAADKHPEPPGLDASTDVSEWAARELRVQRKAFRNFSDYQVYVIASAFVEQRDTWLSHGQWLLRRDSRRE